MGARKRREEGVVDKRIQSILIANGAGVFLAGLAAGFPYAFVVLDTLRDSAASDASGWVPPGDVRGWRMAHLEGVLNGIMLIAIGAAGDRIVLSKGLQVILMWGLIITAWGNIIASVIGPIFGVRGLEFGGSAANTIVYVLFMLAVFAIIAAMLLILRGALAGVAASGKEE